jgi:hypothetical protein
MNFNAGGSLSGPLVIAKGKICASRIYLDGLDPEKQVLCNKGWDGPGAICQLMNKYMVTHMSCLAYHEAYIMSTRAT